MAVARKKKATKRQASLKSAADKRTSTKGSVRSMRAASGKKAVQKTKTCMPKRSAKKGPAFEGLTIRNCRHAARKHFNIDPLYPEQVTALRSLLKGRDSLVVLPTGYGKSLIYQVLAVLADRPVITLFPLIALMRDQELALTRHAVPVVRLDSTLGRRARSEALARVQRGGQLVILTTPETLAAEDLRAVLKKKHPALLCVDEAHCISEWGHDFRPAYLRVGVERAALGNPTVLALTATATPRVQSDIIERLQMVRPATVSVPPHRDNLQLSVQNTPGNLKLSAAGRLIRRQRRPGIVYCATTKAVDEVYAALRRARIPAVRYHGKLTKTERTRAQKSYTRRGPRMVMVATSAFGMGIDKRDIRYILHFQVPGSVEQYVQEAGRAGRDGRPAHCILLFDPADLDIQKRLNAQGQANLGQLRSLGDALAAWGEADRAVAAKDLALSAQVPLTACRALCNQLEEAGLIVRDADRKLSVVVDTKTLMVALEELTRRFATAQHEDTRRLNAIADYADTRECRSVFIRRWFGETDPPKCGKCDRCRPRAPVRKSKQSAVTREPQPSSPPRKHKHHRRAKR